MIRTFIKRLPAALISGAILLGGYAVVKACAGGDWEDGYDSNFTPEAFVDSAYKPFFYSGLFYYDINFDDAHITRFNDENTKEWQTYMGNDLSSRDISFLLTKSSLATISKSKQETAKQKTFVAYLKTAKACESFTTSESGGWYDPESIPPKVKPAGVTAQTLERDMKDSKEAFIKERYWFQLVRYNFFFAPASCIAAFELNKSDFKPSVMYYRTMAYAAGAYYKQKNYSKANYYYSLVFAGNDALKTVAHWSFHPQEEADWNATLKLCANNSQKITLWQMLGIFYGDEERSINEIYKLEPASKSLDVLLSRVINKLESSDQNNKQTIAKTYNWCKKITDEQKTSNPFLWNVTTGYLAYLGNDNPTANLYYNKAQQQLPGTPLAKEQLRLMRLLTQIGSLNKIEASDEAKLLPELNWLLFDTTKSKELRTYEAISLAQSGLADKYKKQSNWVKSECFVSNTSFYKSEPNIRAFITFLDQKECTGFEMLCKKVAAKNQNDLWEYLAIHAAYNDKLEDSRTLMAKAGDLKNIELYGNPFNARINDCHDCDHVMKQKTKYSKLNLIEKLLEMENNVAQNNDVYNNALLVGNAFYNMSYFGNARVFYEGEVIGQGFSDANDIDTVFRATLTDMKVSKKYYQIALKNAANDEQKAKCLYLLSKCERNEWYNAVIYPSNNSNPYYNDRTKDFIKWNNFNALAAYKNTQYYKDVILECGYFRTAMKK